jgi:tripartite ATP-independent transporter DctM subunit
MTKRGYAPSFAVGTVAAGGTLGIMIPPSITFCLYGMLTETSIAQLLMAGILPGLLLSAFLVISIIIRTHVSPSLINHKVEGVDKKSPGELGIAEAREIVNQAKTLAAEEKGTKQANTNLVQKTSGKGPTIFTILPALALIVIVLGSIYLGWATPIEAAGYGVVGSFIIVLAQRRLTKKMFSGVMLNTARTGTMMIFLMVCGTIMSNTLARLGIPQMIATAFANSGLSAGVFLLLITVMWFILGCLMDPASMIILTVPFLLNALVELGFNKVHIGVLVVLAAQIAMITPPVGMNLFVLRANSDVSMGDIIKGAVPYVLIFFVGYVVLALFPDISTIVPKLMGFNVR